LDKLNPGSQGEIPHTALVYVYVSLCNLMDQWNKIKKFKRFSVLALISKRLD
jgi:hypothetical protein